MSLQDMIRGRKVVLFLTNKSGGAVIAGDVVVLDSTASESFTTTTTGQAEAATPTKADAGQAKRFISPPCPKCQSKAKVVQGNPAPQMPER